MFDSAGTQKCWGWSPGICSFLSGQSDFNGWQDGRTAASRFPKGCNTHLSTLPCFCVFFPFFLISPSSLFPPKAECGLESWVGGRDHSLCPSSKAGGAEHQGQVAPASPGQLQGHLESHARLPSPFRPLSLLPSPPEPNANLIYDVCTEEMTLERPFKSSCQGRSPCPGSLLISTPFLLKLKAFSQLGNSC